MQEEYGLWQRMQKVTATAKELGITLVMGGPGWNVDVPHFNGAQLSMSGKELVELEMFLKGLRWGLRFAKFKNGEEDDA